jgi:Flp pilus assembly protein TadG
MMDRFLSRFARAKDGAAAVEFALLAPLMVLVLFGSIELINMLQANQRVENTAISLADVISRDTEVDDDEIDGVWASVTPLMFPSTAVGMDLRITSISFDENNNAEVVWSEVCGVQNSGQCGASSYAHLNAGASVSSNDLPQSNTPGSSLIRVETTFLYRPIIGFFGIETSAGGGGQQLTHSSTPVALTHTAFRRSRLVDPIPRA